MARVDSDYSDEESEESSDKVKKKKKKEKKEKKGKKNSKKEKKAKKEKKEKKKAKKKKKEKKRRKSPSYSDYSYSCGDSRDSRSCSRSRSRSRSRGRQPAARSPARYTAAGGGGGYGNFGGAQGRYGCARSRSRSPAWAVPAPRSPMKFPEGRPLTLAEACEAAGRGFTTGKTAQDDEVQVLNPDEEPIEADRYATFEDARDFPREIREELKNAGFPSPSQIQAYTWPLGLRGKDIIGIAATGSGKTLAFLLPAFAQMVEENHRPERDGPGALVMSPTRELAQQTEAEAQRFGKCLGFRCVAMYGGAPKGEQMARYRQGCHTIVACPGRLNDFLEGGQVRLDGVLKLVLDEADRMLDMGFEPQIRKILAKLPRKRHTLFFTATWPKEVRKLASEILNRPYKVMIGNREVLKGNQDITQIVRVMDAFNKNREIVTTLREAGLTTPSASGKALVFCNTKRMCENLSNELHRQGLPCTSIHGDKDQRQREEALNGLKSGRYKVLIATDVAARGLDIKGVGLVINFDPANNTEDYVHRIGRTGRAGAKGYAITFMTGQDAAKAKGIIEVMERTKQEISPELMRLAGAAPAGGRQLRHRGKGGGRNRSPSF
ncbi:unnamed protein product [Durusdinium trenchii]|uniref:DEAD-box ATP-dependent RNA helicase 46 n=2 Tax=Durusdinium trenchii TaxID=1381693 RepID=A0ABP0H7S8_9DINO